MAMSVNDNDGQFYSPDWKKNTGTCGPAWLLQTWAWGLSQLAGRQQGEGIVRCPMASKFVYSEESESVLGGTFRAWFLRSTYAEWTPYGCDVYYSGRSNHDI